VDAEAERQDEAVVAVELVREIGAGARGAEQRLVERYGPALLYLLKRKTRDLQLALDLRQDTFRLVIEKLRAGGIEQPERLAAYVRGVAVNLCIAVQRKEYRRATTADSETVEATAADAPGPFEAVSAEQQGRALRQLLDELPTPRDRDILLRTYLAEEEKSSICQSLGIDSEHFNRVLFRARQRFRELLVRAERQGRIRLLT
jgi:RNA polymerase sigma-70 factor (ECF subfamily)